MFYFVCFPERNRWLQPFNKRLVRVIMEGGRGLEIKFINFCVCSAFEWCLQWFCGTFDVVVCDISSGVVQLGQYFIPSLGEVNRYFRGWARGSVNQVTNQSVKEVWSLLPFLQQRKDKKGLLSPCTPSETCPTFVNLYSPKCLPQPTLKIFSLSHFKTKDWVTRKFGFT